MKFLLPFILVIVLIGKSIGQEYKPTSFGNVAAEFGGGAVGMAIGTFVAGTASLFVAASLFSNDDDWHVILSRAMPFGLAGAIIGGTAGCAAGTFWTGNLLLQEGKYLPTLLGATLGAAVCCGLIIYHHWDLRFDVSTVLTFCLPPVGSVIGYDWSRLPLVYSQSSIWSRFAPPTFSFRTEKRNDNKIIPVYDFRFINARF